MDNMANVARKSRKGPRGNCAAGSPSGSSPSKEESKGKLRSWFPLKKTLCAMIFFLFPFCLQAMTMNDKDQGKLSLSLGELNVERSDGQRLERYTYRAQYHLPISDKGIGLNLGILTAPDFEKRSQKINIFQDITTAYVLLNANKVYYLRYNVAVGPGIQWNQLRYEFFDIKEKDHFFQPILLVDAAIDYAVTTSWGVGVHSLWQWREDFLRMDWGYYLAIQWSGN